jgi:hypothetical protein
MPTDGPEAAAIVKEGEWASALFNEAMLQFSIDADNTYSTGSNSPFSSYDPEFRQKRSIQKVVSGSRVT